MKKHLIPTKILTILALVLAGLVVVSCTTAAEPTEAPTTAPQPTSPPADEHDDEHLEGDPVRGGLLYDKWWAVEESE
ncbi:MAG: hypothetical protein ACE5GO_06745, partial [Anaerolineales bacterium]